MKIMDVKSKRPEQLWDFNCLNTALKYCLDYIEAFWGGVPTSTDKVYTEYIYNWYRYTDIRNPKVLAALALQFGDYQIISCSDIETAINNFFEEEGCGGNGY